MRKRLGNFFRCLRRAGEPPRAENAFGIYPFSRSYA